VPTNTRRAQKKRDQAFGRSRGGLSTKVHLACDGLCNPLRLVLTGGEVHEVTQAPLLLADFHPNQVIADKGYDSDTLVTQIEKGGGEAVIPARGNRRHPREHDAEVYKERNQIERLINRLKQCRRLATRYEKTARNFLAFLHLASLMIWLA
jgi:transposase